MKTEMKEFAFEIGELAFSIYFYSFYKSIHLIMIKIYHINILYKSTTINRK
jgi:hypothetical protein